jgi:hypothetical protein
VCGEMNLSAAKIEGVNGIQSHILECITCEIMNNENTFSFWSIIFYSEKISVSYLSFFCTVRAWQSKIDYFQYMFFPSCAHDKLAWGEEITIQWDTISVCGPGSNMSERDKNLLLYLTAHLNLFSQYAMWCNVTW